MVTAIWRDKRALHTAVHSHDPQAQHDAQDIATGLDTTRRQLREWHVCRAKELAQEQQSYFQNPQPYKSLKHVDKVWQPRHQGGTPAKRHSEQQSQSGPWGSPQQLPTPTQHLKGGVIRVVRQSVSVGSFSLQSRV